MKVADDRSIPEAEKLILHAIKENLEPPAEFALAVLSGEIQLTDATMFALMAKGWLKRTKCEVWSRVMGYFRPVDQWNDGKKSEYAERVTVTNKDIVEFGK